MANIFSQLVPIEQQGERVLTTAQLAQFYGCKEIQIQQNFANNKERFVEGKHFFKLEGESLKDFKVSLGDSKISSTLKFTSILLLWTRQGAARHSKMLGTDKAWDVFETLEESYFAPRKSVTIADIVANPDLGITLLTQLKEERARTQALQEHVAIQSQQIAELQPKASYCDKVLQSEDALPITVIAKDYGKSAVWFNKTLHVLGVQYKQGGIWLLYQKYASEHYTITKTYVHTDEDGKEHTHVHTYWTQKGRLFLYYLLKEHGVLPLMEQEEDIPQRIAL